MIDWWGHNMFNNLLHESRLIRMKSRSRSWEFYPGSGETTSTRVHFRKKTNETLFDSTRRVPSEKWHQHVDGPTQMFIVNRKRFSSICLCWAIFWKITCHLGTRVSSGVQFYFPEKNLSRTQLWRRRKRQILNYMLNINL